MKISNGTPNSNLRKYLERDKSDLLTKYILSYRIQRKRKKGNNNNKNNLDSVTV